MSSGAARPRARSFPAILGVGIDLVDVARVRRELARDGGGFRDAVFTPSECSYCDARRYPARHYAARFAAKEAFVKALNGGVPLGSLREIEVRAEGSGAPRIVLHGAARRAAERLGLRGTFVSLSHTAALATASVVVHG